MKINIKLIIPMVVAVVAFVAGRSTLFTSAPAFAYQNNDKPKTKPQVPEEMEAMMQAMERFGSPGPNHKYLEPAIGEFNAVVKFRMEPKSEWVESKGTVERQWVLEKHFIREVVDATSPLSPDPFKGLSYIGYNNYDGQYEIVWMENHSTAMVFETGSFDPESKVMTLRSSHRNPATGRLMVGRGTWDLSNPDRQVYTGYTFDEDGREFKNFEGVFERRKK